MRGIASGATGQAADGLIGYPIGAQGAENWLSQFKTFLVEFGDRIGGGYRFDALLTTPTWRDHPLLAVQLAAQFLDANVKSPDQLRKESRELVDAEVHALCVHCPDPQIVENFQ